jgi:large-conductance mechanosensitive channel
MRFDTRVSKIAQTAGTELKHHLLYGMRIFAPAIGLWMGLLIISAPVLAQIPKNLVCNGAGKLISAVFGLLIVALVVYGVFHLINGWRKISSPNPEKKKKGREEIKGGGMMFAGALFTTGLPSALRTIGLTVFNCIHVSPI